MLRKILVLVIMLAMCGSASGVMIFDMPGNRQTSSSEEDFRLEGGLRVSFWGIVRDMESEGEPKECVYTIFTVTSEEDSHLTVSSDAVFDSIGRKFPDYIGASISGNSDSSEIIADVPTPVYFVHKVPSSYKELPGFSRMRFTFNGQAVELRKKESVKWEEWKKTYAVKDEALEAWLETSPSASSMYYGARKTLDLSVLPVFEGHHYKLFGPENISWTQARDKCINMGGHLVTITSAEENAFIITTFLENSPTCWCWIGAEEVHANNWTGTWKWLNGEYFGFTYWHHDGYAKERNDYHHVSFKFAHVGNNKPDVWRWERCRYDDSAVIWFTYICEWDF